MTSVTSPTVTSTQNRSATHRVISPRVLYFGTPVVLVSTENPDGTFNLAPMSSAWWVGTTCMLGLDETSATTLNLRRTGEVVLNLPDATMAGPVNQLALTTGTPVVPPHKIAKNYVYVADKFSHAKLSPVESDLVRPPWVAECPLALEGSVSEVRPFGGADSGLVSVEVEVLRTHARHDMLVHGSDRHIDPERWDPLLMKFTHLYGFSSRLESSVLAKGWQIPEPTPGPITGPPTEWAPVYEGVAKAVVAETAAVSKWHLQTGAELPEHDHERVEHILVRRGCWALSNGRILREGDVLTTDVGNTHGGTALSDTELWAVEVHQ